MRIKLPGTEALDSPEVVLAERARAVKLHTSVPHSPGDLASAGVVDQESSEVWMSGHSDDILPQHSSLAQHQLPALLEDAVQSVKDAGAADVGSVQHQPVTSLHGGDQDAVDPLESSFLKIVEL